MTTGDETFDSHIVIQGECEVWTGRCDKDGYGEVSRIGKVWKAHRWAWTVRHGPIPTGLNVLHHCDNPPCTKDEHHFLGTQADNVSDMARKDRHGRMKITMTEATRIRSEVLSGSRGTAARLSEEFGVSPSCISKIANGIQRA